ncbi:MAG: hypothetical protein N2645_01145 [Clostridia bacterium]|nr:hypothetical protein [Clostridia bacterium]
MFFQRKILNNTGETVAEKIKKELLSTFHKKGINISKLVIDMNSNNLNVEVCIKGK